MKNRDCEPSLVRSIRGPITLITLGALFALNNFTQYSFDKTWPVLLIVFGLLSLLKRSLEPALPPPPPPPVFPPPQYNFPPPPPQGSYVQSPYAQPPAKGGFGSTAPRPVDTPGQTPPAIPGDSV
ncbi:MAG: hypothetical protein JWP63_6550 [Candidatus Solibacter sp.]|jgi:hypothetical protein|nr:hypothetical protein [Candidatus Solibacter sp.]